MAVNNSIALITKYSTEYFDKVYKQEAVTSILDATNSRAVKFDGARTVRIAKLSTGGLLDYDRTVSDYPENVSLGGLGYGQTSAVYKWETFTMRMDRAAKIPIEYFDDEESGGELVGLATTEFSRTAIIPEVDAYALSEIAAHASYSSTEATTDANALAQLNLALTKLEEEEVPADDQVIFVSPAFMNYLRNSTAIVKYLSQNDYQKDVKFRIESYEGRPIITVAPRRFHGGFMKIPTGGYGFETGSRPIDFLVVAKSAVMHVVKYDKVKVLSGDMNLAASNQDGYTIYARIYHDVFIPDNKRAGIYVKYNGTSGGMQYRGTLNVTVGANNKVTGYDVLPADVAFVKVAKGTVSNGKLTSYTELKIGDTTPTGATAYYAIDADDAIVAGPWTSTAHS